MSAADLAQWWTYETDGYDRSAGAVVAGDALLAALEAERERIRRMSEDHAEYRRNAAAALEATAAERDELRGAVEAWSHAAEVTRAERDRAHATLREIAERATSQAAYSIAEVARERLENP